MAPRCSGRRRALVPLEPTLVRFGSVAHDGWLLHGWSIARCRCFLWPVDQAKKRAYTRCVAAVVSLRVCLYALIAGAQADGSASGSVVAGMVSGGAAAALVCAAGVGGAAAGVGELLK